MGGYFVYSGYNHFKNLPAMTGFAKMKNVPAARVMVIVSGVMLVLGGAAIIVNRYAILGMCLLVLFIIPTTIIMHNFWKEKDVAARMSDRIHFTKNIAILGALILLISIG